MPEAVIVDAARTPIGRAFKGSLATQRPDDMGAFIVDQSPRAQRRRRPRLGRGGHHRLRPAAGQAGLQHRPHHRAAVREAPDRGQRLDGLALLRLGARRDPHRRQLCHRRSGRRLHRRRRGVRSPSTTSARRPPASPTRTRSCRAASRRAERLHPDGRHGRQRGQEATRSAARTWTSTPSARRSWPCSHRRTASSTARSPRSPSRTAPSSPRTTARARAPRSRSSRSCPRPSAAAA